MTIKPDFMQMSLEELGTLKGKLEGQLDENPMSRSAEEWLEEIESAILDLQASTIDVNRGIPDFSHMSIEEVLSIREKLLLELETNPLNDWAETWLDAIQTVFSETGTLHLIGIHDEDDEA